MTPTPQNTFALAARILWMRFRFVLAVAGLFGLIALWQQFGAMWDRAVLWASGKAAIDRGISPDTEYFCPMCPGVLAAWPEKCPVCKMPLVRRTKGSSQLLPEGVTARMQISPYRLQLAGIKTSPVGYLPLTHEIRTSGQLLIRSASDGNPSDSPDRGLAPLVVATIPPWDVPFAAVGTPVELSAAWLPAGRMLAGTIESIAAATDAAAAGELLIRISDPPAALAPGASVQVVARVSLAAVEPYRSQPRDLPPLAADAKNSYFLCPDHPAWIRTHTGKCPFDDRDLEERSLRDDQRLEWSCRWHADVHRAANGDPCPHCQRPSSSPCVVTYVPAGEVLVIPESAVIDTGALRLVYVETMAGMFDGVIVELGTKEGSYYPVLSGLQPGQRVATAGAFLLDAETRLNPSLAAGYFGAGSDGAAGGSSSILAGGSPAANAPDLLATLKLAPDDLLLARRQKVCPITRAPLGSMGELVRVEVEGEPVYLCCEACRDSVRVPSKQPGRDDRSSTSPTRQRATRLPFQERSSWGWMDFPRLRLGLVAAERALP